MQTSGTNTIKFSAEQSAPTKSGHGFGTAPVFLASISTILGAILFLRFGYAVAHTGLIGALEIILLGHLVTVPTALAIAEISTNRRVEGGGAYFIISRSFGTTIGGAIGISLYLSQAVSVAFYMIAFAEAFGPLAPWLESVTGLTFDHRIVSIPGSILLAALVLTKGAKLGINALWGVFAVLGISLLLFFLGSPTDGAAIPEIRLFDTVPKADPFMLVFAIVFPAFTGIIAGVGLSGDLKNPRKAIPFGIISATLTGMVIYVSVAFKLAASAAPEVLDSDQLIMSRIALWGPIIPIGLACATLSSAIGSILVAPRTLQAMAEDGIVPVKSINRFLASGVGEANEPRNATLLTAILALATVFVGNIDLVARIVSMFFMVTYGALCAISFLEHFASRPSYRPSFRSKWYISLTGALICLFLMFQMDPIYALLAILLMIVIYRVIRAAQGGEGDFAAIFHGVLTQANRYSQIKLQHRAGLPRSDEWRPSIIMVNGRTFTRSAPLQFFSWLCHRYGFGTYLHHMSGQLDAKTFSESREVLNRLITTTRSQNSAVYVDTMISPSMRSALAQTLQVPGISGMENNTILFEFSMVDGPEVLNEVHEGSLMASAPHMNVLVLRHGGHFFGSHSTIHIWLTWHDYKNASLMILLAYMLLGHPTWHEAEIRIFAAFPYQEVGAERAKLNEMITTGRLPIGPKNLRIFPTDERVDFKSLVHKYSSMADLVMLGFTDERLREKGIELLQRHTSLKDVLFVSAQQRILIE